jgi:hypothetical protein
MFSTPLHHHWHVDLSHHAAHVTFGHDLPVVWLCSHFASLRAMLPRVSCHSYCDRFLRRVRAWQLRAVVACWCVCSLNAGDNDWCCVVHTNARVVTPCSRVSCVRGVLWNVCHAARFSSVSCICMVLDLRVGQWQFRSTRNLQLNLGSLVYAISYGRPHAFHFGSSV